MHEADSLRQDVCRLAASPDSVSFEELRDVLQKVEVLRSIRLRDKGRFLIIEIDGFHPVTVQRPEGDEPVLRFYVDFLLVIFGELGLMEERDDY